MEATKPTAPISRPPGSRRSRSRAYPWTLENMAVGGPLFPKHLGEGLVDADGDFGNIQFPEVPDTDIQLAKSMVQAIRNAGYSAVNTLETKLYKIAADFTEESADYLVHIGEIILYLKDMARLSWSTRRVKSPSTSSAGLIGVRARTTTSGPSWTPKAECT